MSELLHVSSSPHVRDKVNTGNIMLTVLIALLPSALFGVYNFGPHADADTGRYSLPCCHRSSI